MVKDYLFPTSKLVSSQASVYEKQNYLHAMIFFSLLFLPGYMLLLFYKNVILDPNYNIICTKSVIENLSTQIQRSTLILIWWGFPGVPFEVEVEVGVIAYPLLSTAYLPKTH